MSNAAPFIDSDGKAIEHTCDVDPHQIVASSGESFIAQLSESCPACQEIAREREVVMPGVLERAGAFKGLAKKTLASEAKKKAATSPTESTLPDGTAPKPQGDNGDIPKNTPQNAGQKK